MAITPVFAAGGDSDVAGLATVDGRAGITSLAGAGVDGGRAFDINLTAAKGQLFTPGFGGTILVAQFRFQFVTLPGANVDAVAGMYPNNLNGKMGWTQSTGVLNIGVGATVSQGSTALIAGTWYTVDWRWNLVANPWIIDWSVNGIAQPQASIATAADSNPGFAIGTDAGAGINNTYHAQYDHIVVSVTSADYGMAPKRVVPWTVQTVTGTHNQTAGDLQTDASVNVADGDSTGSKLVEIPANTTTFVKQTVIRSTTYYEALYGAGAATVAPQGVQQTVATALVSGTTGTEKSQLFDGTTASDTYAVSSPGGTGLIFKTKMWAAPPSGGSWTAAQLNAARLRWGFAGNVTGPPFVSFSTLEAIFDDVTGSAPAAVAFLSPLLGFGRLLSPLAVTPAAATFDPSTGFPWNLDAGEAFVQLAIWPDITTDTLYPFGPPLNAVGKTTWSDDTGEGFVPSQFTPDDTPEAFGRPPLNAAQQQAWFDDTGEQFVPSQFRPDDTLPAFGEPPLNATSLTEFAVEGGEVQAQPGDDPSIQSWAVGPPQNAVQLSAWALPSDDERQSVPVDDPSVQPWPAQTIAVAAPFDPSTGFPWTQPADDNIAQPVWSDEAQALTIGPIPFIGNEDEVQTWAPDWFDPTSQSFTIQPVAVAPFDPSTGFPWTRPDEAVDRSFQPFWYEPEAVGVWTATLPAVTTVTGGYGPSASASAPALYGAATGPTVGAGAAGPVPAGTASNPMPQRK